MKQELILNKTREEIYFLFAQCFCPPGWVDLPLKQVVKRLTSLLSDISLLSTEVVEKLIDYSSNGEEEYNNLFIMENPVIPLTESSYFPEFKKTCQLLTAKSDSKIYTTNPQEIMRELLSDLGIKLPDSYTSTPDHLVLELELMGLLCQYTNVKNQHDFLTTRLSWFRQISQFIDDKISFFYSKLMNVIIIWIDREQFFLEAQIYAD